MLKNFEAIKEKTYKNSKRYIGVVVAQDKHTLEAVAHAVRDNIVEPVLYGQVDEINSLWKVIAPDLLVPEIVMCENDEQSIRNALNDTRSGKLDCLMKGHIETGTLMKAVVNHDTGIRKNKVLSAVALVDSPYYHKIFALTDIALVTYPNLEQKQAVLQNAVELMHALDVPNPKVGVLAAVEKENPKMPETVDAAVLKEKNCKGEISGCIVEGPISLDLCVDPEAARIKNFQSDVAGDPDILVVPDIVAGNLMVKTLTCLGNASSFGVVVGATVPIIITSRSSSSKDKYRSIVLATAVGRM